MTTHADRIRQMGEQADEMAAAALGVETYERWSDEFASKRDAAFAQLVAEDCARVCEDDANEWDGHAAQDDIDLDDERMSMARSESLKESAETIRARYSLKD